MSWAAHQFEVYAVERVVGYGEGLEAEQEFRPFYASVDADGGSPSHGYFTVRREPRALSERQRRDGPRTSYMGSEVSLSLVDTDASIGSEAARKEIRASAQGKLDQLNAKPAP